MKSRIADMWPYVRRKTDASLERLIRKLLCEKMRIKDAPCLDRDSYQDLMLAYIELDKGVHDTALLGSTAQAGLKQGQAISSESDGIALGAQYAFISQYAGLGPVENSGGIAGLAERLQRLLLGL